MRYTYRKMSNSAKTLNRRFLPLYSAAFLQGFVLWYAVEKVFIKGIGFTDSTIGIMIAIYSLLILLIETPSGLLADRWSRKGVLIIGSCCLAASSLVGGLSHSVPQYIAANLLWGFYFAMFSGTYDSIVYDTLHEESGHSRQFDKYYGRVNLVDSSAMVLSSLLGASIGGVLGFSESYFLTIPFSLFSILFLFAFDEPKVHKSEITVPIKQQIRTTIRATVRNRAIFLIVINLVILNLLTYIILEFSQLWHIALAVPVALYGLANALLLMSLGIGGVIVDKLKLYRFPVFLVLLLLALFSSIGLVYGRSFYLILASLVTLTTILVSLNVIFNRVLHDSLSSSIRAGASSAVSTFGRLLIIPTSITLGYLSNIYGIFTAANVLVILVMVLCLFAFLEARKDSCAALYPKE